MSEDTATDAGLESFSGFSIVQPELTHSEGNDDEIRIAGSSTDPSSSQNVSSSTEMGRMQSLDSIRENLSKQQERLSALRERALKKSEDGRRKSSVSDSMESLRSLGHKLTALKSRSTGGNVSARDDSTDAQHILSEMASRNVSTPISTPAKDADTSATPSHISGSEKLLMLTQRTVQNRALLEQRKRDMAKSLLSVKSNLSNTSTSGGELGSSMTDLRTAAAPVSRHRSAADLQLQSNEQFDEERLKLLKNKMKLNEMKQSRKEQEMQQDLLELRNELTLRSNRIEDLEQTALQLQQTLTLQNEELNSLRLISSKASESDTDVTSTRERNAELEDINDMLETTRRELQDELSTAREKLSSTEAELYALQQQQQAAQGSAVPEPASTDEQVNAELAKQVQELEKQLEILHEENEKLRSDIEANAHAKLDVSDANISDHLTELKSTIEAQRIELEARAQTISAQQEDLAEKTTEVNVLNVNLRVLEDKLMRSSKSKPIFLATASDEDANAASEELQAELRQLKQKLDDSNKTNIKLKLKCKQTEKHMEKLMASSELHKELQRLSAENDTLQQQVTVLEDEKGQWQLAHVHDAAGREDNSEFVHQQQATEAIRRLEEQKLELQQALQTLQQGNETARVESELSEVQMEEQLSHRVQELEAEALEQQDKLRALQGTKDELDKKLSHYINENMELLDKLEKLSKSSSSAESIEIVERPTQQERDELECYNKLRPSSAGDSENEAETVAAKDGPQPSFVSELTQTETDTAESAELLAKIELFSTERREVLEKMEHLNAENAELHARIEQYEAEAQQLESAKSKLEHEVDSLHREKERQQLLSLQVSDKSNLSQELSSMQKSSEVVAALDCGEGAALFDKCEKSLSKLNSELEAYRKANDRNSKFNVSKKLAKEAKNVHTQLTELLQKVKEASSAVETVTVVETVVAVTAPNGKALAEYEQLTAQNAQLKATVAILERELSELRGCNEPLAIEMQASEEQQQQQLAELQSTLEELRMELREARVAETERVQLIAEQSAELTQLQLQAEQFDQAMNSKEMLHEQQLEQLTRVRRELEGKNETYEGELNILQTLIAEQKQQLIEAYGESEHKLNMKLLELQQCQEQLAALRSELSQRQAAAGEDAAALAEECSNLRESLRVNKTLAQQQVIELANKQESIDALRDEMKAMQDSGEQALQLQRQLEADVVQLTAAHEASETRNKELREKLKKYAVNLKKRGVEMAELEQKLLEHSKQKQMTEALEAPLVAQAQQQLEQQLQQEQTAVTKLNEELKHKIHINLENRDTIRQLKQQLQESAHQADELQRLQLELQTAWDANDELRRESNARQTKWEADERMWRERLEHDRGENMAVLRQQLDQKSTKFEKSKEVIKHRNATIQSLQRELNELRAQLRAQPEEEMESESLYVALQQEHARLKEQYASEKAAFEQTIARLETLHDGIQAKLEQDRSYIESLEAENDELKAKGTGLEEQMTTLAQQHALMQERLEQLEKQLQASELQYREHESQLHERLQQLSQLEQSQSRQLAELGKDAEDGRMRLETLQLEHEELLAKHSKLSAEAQLERDQLASRSDQELLEVREQLQHRESELQRQRATYDAKLAVKTTELDELECELSAHMERATTELRDLTQQLERSQEQLQHKTEELARLGDELGVLNREAAYLRLQQGSAEQDALDMQELRMQTLQDKTEIDHLRSQIDALCANHNQELQALQQQIAEHDALGQNQTDDQVYIQTENKRLADQLAELQARVAQESGEQARELNEAREQVQRLQIELAALRADQARPLHGGTVAPTTAATLTTTATPTDMLAAPAVFFGTDMSAPSPFDEIVQPRLTSTQLGAAPSNVVFPPPPDYSNSSLSVAGGVLSPTIEDLQRNVSDLEKHAQDLETKLLARNQKLGEYEERLQQQQQQQRQQHERYLADMKAALDERDTRLSALQAQQDEAQRTASARQSELEELLHTREQEISQLCVTVEERERLAAVDKLIQPDLGQAGPTLDMFFGAGESATDNVDLSGCFPQVEPVVEELIVPKKAYICHPQETQQVSDWGVDEDPWASAAAAAEQTEPRPLDDALSARVAELERQLAAAEEQKAELQTKTAKLMKRVKEYKSKAATANATQDSGGGGFNLDLDSAIIDELKHQIELHEAKQSKTEELLQQHSQEKEKLLKRIDTLTAGNERMADLKERQDMDVQMYQARIREMQEKLNQLESWGDGGEDIKPVTQLPLAAAISDKETLGKIDDLQAENQELNSECQELQAQLLSEKQSMQRAQAAAAQALSDKEELREQMQRLSDENQQLIAAQAALTATTTHSDEHMALLQERESEILHLKQRIEELMREDQTEKLVFEILTKNQELQLLRMQVRQLEEDKGEAQAAAAAAVPPAPAESAASQTLQLELDQLVLQNNALAQEKSDLEEELRVLNNHVLASLELEDKMKQSVLELDTKNIEITELRKSLEALQQAQPQSTVDVNALNQQWEAVVEQKCSELARVWQEHLAQREADFSASEAQWRTQIEQLTAALEGNKSATETKSSPAMGTESISYNVNTDYSETAAGQHDVNEMLIKMQKALETQEMEIVTLKEQLAIRSAEYARLAAQYDPFRLQNTLNSGNAPPSTGSARDPLPEYVLKADLDYALMMVHQRDMRVEEMILELVQLLEERDHLQLKLSDTLRQLEAERTRGNDELTFAAADEAIAPSGSAIATTTSPATVGSSSSSELSALSSGSSSSELKQKLAQLQTVKHSKDKAIVDERELRLQQMMQLHKDMAKPATITPDAPAPTTATAAVEQPLGVDLSQPALRSPSMGLMDWILGNKNDDESQQAHK